MTFFSKPKFFKLFISPYKLQRERGASLKGALLSFDFGSNLKGYSDFLPWPSFNKEAPLLQQLRQIQKGQLSLRFLIARHNAFLDAKARSQKRSLFFGLKIPKSHFLIEDLSCFKKTNLKWDPAIIKVKLQPHKKAEQIQHLKNLNQQIPGVKWRLDLNGRSWREWKAPLKFLKSNIDFIEDPLLEKDLFKGSDHRLFAEDWLSLPSAQIKIVKPSRDRIDLLIKNPSFSRWKRVIFTHSKDHLFGQAIAGFWAGQFYKLYPRFFETGAFVFSGLNKIKAYHLAENSKGFIPPAGFGFGFGDFLKKEPWVRWI